MSSPLSSLLCTFHPQVFARCALASESGVEGGVVPSENCGDQQWEATGGRTWTVQWSSTPPTRVLTTVEQYKDSKQWSW